MISLPAASAAVSFLTAELLGRRKASIREKEAQQPSARGIRRLFVLPGGDLASTKPHTERLKGSMLLFVSVCILPTKGKLSAQTVEQLFQRWPRKVKLQVTPLNSTDASGQGLDQYYCIVVRATALTCFKP